MSPPDFTMRLIRLLSLMLMLLGLSGCASFAASATSKLANNLSGAILNQDDPETVEAGAPAYLLLVDSLIDLRDRRGAEGSPSDTPPSGKGTLGAAG